MAGEKIKTIFIGTPDFGVPFLKALVNAKNFLITGVITQPDKPIGRKQVLTPPAVKSAALELGLPVYQSDKISSLTEVIKPADLIVVVAYGQIIPKTILELPKYGIINLHPSLLPEYRGSSPIQAAILNGDAETGVTIMKMEEKLDTGPILRQNIVNIEAAETSGSLFSKLINGGLEIFIPTLEDYVKGNITPQAQADAQASYIHELVKSDGRIDWKKTAAEIERMVRAYDPWPGTFTETDGIKIKILKAEIAGGEEKHDKPGEIYLDNGRLAVKCGAGALLVSRLQPAGKKEMTDKEFLNGYRRMLGKRFK